LAGCCRCSELSRVYWKKDSYPPPQFFSLAASARRDIDWVRKHARREVLAGFHRAGKFFKLVPSRQCLPTAAQVRAAQPPLSGHDEGCPNLLYRRREPTARSDARGRARQRQIPIAYCGLRTPAISFRSPSPNCPVLSTCVGNRPAHDCPPPLRWHRYMEPAQPIGQRVPIDYIDRAIREHYLPVHRTREGIYAAVARSFRHEFRA
jgi:hypothetical protein